MSGPSFRRRLSMPGMLRTMRECFDRVPDPLKTRTMNLSDRLMSGLAVFSPGCRPCRGSTRWCGGGRIRSGRGTPARRSAWRRRPRTPGCANGSTRSTPRDLRRCFKRVHADLQRGRVLDNRKILDGHLPIPVDGTGRHSSHRVRYRRRCVRNRRDGSKRYHHQILGAAIVHPDPRRYSPWRRSRSATGTGRRRTIASGGRRRGCRTTSAASIRT